MNGIKLRGTGRCVPANTVTNDDLSRLVDTNDEWITARTGIRSRYRCEKETLTELCVSAARDALHMAGITPADIGVCIVATVSADTVVPSAACLLQRALGLFAQPEDWRRVQAQGMGRDFGWEASARAYEGVYRRILVARRLI